MLFRSDAITGFTALGEFGSISEAAQTLVSIERFYEPNRALAKLYTEKYEEYAHLQHT